MIYFYQELVKTAEKNKHDLKELNDVRYDMDKIDKAMNDLDSIEGKKKAYSLNIVMRNKYPTIDIMLNVGNMLKPNKKVSKFEISFNDLKSEEYKMLEQDKYGIVCDVLLKKNIIRSIEQFIERVD